MFPKTLTGLTQCLLPSGLLPPKLTAPMRTACWLTCTVRGPPLSPPQTVAPFPSCAHAPAQIIDSVKLPNFATAREQSELDKTLCFTFWSIAGGAEQELSVQPQPKETQLLLFDTNSKNIQEASPYAVASKPVNLLLELGRQTGGKRLRST